MSPNNIKCFPSIRPSCVCVVTFTWSLKSSVIPFLLRLVGHHWAGVQMKTYSWYSFKWFNAPWIQSKKPPQGTGYGGRYVFFRSIHLLDPHNHILSQCNYERPIMSVCQGRGSAGLHFNWDGCMHASPSEWELIWIHLISNHYEQDWASD